MSEHVMNQSRAPRWVGISLAAAGVYNLAWGSWVVLFPATAFRWMQMPEPRYPELWQCIGMIVGVYGVGYLIAAQDPAKHWAIILVGLLGKIFGPIGFLQALITGSLPIQFGYILLCNDLIWWFPLVAALQYALKQHRERSAETVGSTSAPAAGRINNEGDYV